MMAGMLTSPVVNSNAKTPPINAKGRFSRTTPLCTALPNSMYSSRNMTTMLMSEVRRRVRLADCSLSNCPPYSIWYPSGSTICASILSWMSFTTPLRSLPAVLAEMTIFLLTFSLLMVFGPEAETTSATYESGTLLPAASSIIRLRICSIVPRLSSSALTTRSNVLPCS